MRGNGSAVIAPHSVISTAIAALADIAQIAPITSANIRDCTELLVIVAIISPAIECTPGIRDVRSVGGWHANRVKLKCAAFAGA